VYKLMFCTFIVVMMVLVVAKIATLKRKTHKSRRCVKFKTISRAFKVFTLS